MRYVAVVPLLCSIVAFILSMLCLFAGSKPNFMEDYAIVTLNTSTLGHVLLPTPTSTSSPSSSPTSLSSWLTSTFHNLTSSIESSIEADLQSIEGDVADLLAKRLGISQWYSLHMMDLCEGVFTPNTTSLGAWYNATKCSNRTVLYQFNPTAAISSELSIAGHPLNLSSISWPPSIQDGINKLNAAFAATSILYLLGIAFAGVSIMASLLSIFLSSPSRLIALGNVLLTFLSFLCLAVTSTIITVCMVKISDIVNQYGNEIGAYAYKGGKFLALTWTAVALMGVASLGWVVDCCMGRGKRRERRMAGKAEMGEKEKGHVKGWGGRF